MDDDDTGSSNCIVVSDLEEGEIIDDEGDDFYEDISFDNDDNYIEEIYKCSTSHLSSAKSSGNIFGRHNISPNGFNPPTVNYPLQINNYSIHMPLKKPIYGVIDDHHEFRPPKHSQLYYSSSSLDLSDDDILIEEPCKILKRKSSREKSSKVHQVSREKLYKEAEERIRAKPNYIKERKLKMKTKHDDPRKSKSKKIIDEKKYSDNKKTYYSDSDCKYHISIFQEERKKRLENKKKSTEISNCKSSFKGKLSHVEAIPGSLGEMLLKKKLKQGVKVDKSTCISDKVSKITDDINITKSSNQILISTDENEGKEMISAAEVLTERNIEQTSHESTCPIEILNEVDIDQSKDFLCNKENENSAAIFCVKKEPVINDLDQEDEFTLRLKALQSTARASKVLESGICEIILKSNDMDAIDKSGIVTLPADCPPVVKDTLEAQSMCDDMEISDDDSQDLISSKKATESNKINVEEYLPKNEDPFPVQWAYMIPPPSAKSNEPDNDLHSINNWCYNQNMCVQTMLDSTRGPIHSNSILIDETVGTGTPVIDGNQFPDSNFSSISIAGSSLSSDNHLPADDLRDDHAEHYRSFMSNILSKTIDSISYGLQNQNGKGNSNQPLNRTLTVVPIEKSKVVKNSANPKKRRRKRSTKSASGELTINSLEEDEDILRAQLLKQMSSNQIETVAQYLPSKSSSYPEREEKSSKACISKSISKLQGKSLQSFRRKIELSKTKLILSRDGSFQKTTTTIPEGSQNKREFSMKNFPKVKPVVISIGNDSDSSDSEVVVDEIHKKNVDSSIDCLLKSIRNSNNNNPSSYSREKRRTPRETISPAKDVVQLMSSDKQEEYLRLKNLLSKKKKMLRKNKNLESSGSQKTLSKLGDYVSSESVTLFLKPFALSHNSNIKDSLSDANDILTNSASTTQSVSDDQQNPTINLASETVLQECTEKVEVFETMKNDSETLTSVEELSNDGNVNDDIQSEVSKGFESPSLENLASDDHSSDNFSSSSSSSSESPSSSSSSSSSSEDSSDSDEEVNFKSNKDETQLRKKLVNALHQRRGNINSQSVTVDNRLIREDSPKEEKNSLYVIDTEGNYDQQDSAGELSEQGNSNDLKVQNASLDTALKKILIPKTTLCPENSDSLSFQQQTKLEIKSLPQRNSSKQPIKKCSETIKPKHGTLIPKKNPKNELLEMIKNEYAKKFVGKNNVKHKISAVLRETTQMSAMRQSYIRRVSELSLQLRKMRFQEKRKTLQIKSNLARLSSLQQILDKDIESLAQLEKRKAQVTGITVSAADQHLTSKKNLQEKQQLMNQLNFLEKSLLPCKDSLELHSQERNLKRSKKKFKIDNRCIASTKSGTHSPPWSSEERNDASDLEILCPYYLLGRCNDDMCPYNHTIVNQEKSSKTLKEDITEGSTCSELSYVIDTSPSNQNCCVLEVSNSNLDLYEHNLPQTDTSSETISKIDSNSYRIEESDTSEDNPRNEDRHESDDCVVSETLISAKDIKDEFKLYNLRHLKVVLTKLPLLISTTNSKKGSSLPCKNILEIEDELPETVSDEASTSFTNVRQLPSGSDANINVSLEGHTGEESKVSCDTNTPIANINCSGTLICSKSVRKLTANKSSLQSEGDVPIRKRTRASARLRQKK